MKYERDDEHEETELDLKRSRNSEESQAGVYRMGLSHTVMRWSPFAAKTHTIGSASSLKWMTMSHHQWFSS